MHFREWKVLYFDKYSIGLDDVLVPNRRQTFIWTNADRILWRIYAGLEGDELSKSIAWIWNNWWFN